MQYYNAAQIDALWREVGKSSESNDYQKLLLYYALLEHIGPDDGLASQVPELLRLLGAIPDTSSGILGYKGNFSPLFVQDFKGGCQSSREIPAYGLLRNSVSTPASKVINLTNPDAEWTVIDEVAAESIWVRVLDDAEAMIGSAILSSQVGNFFEHSYVSREGQVPSDLLRSPTPSGNRTANLDLDSALFMSYPLCAEWGHVWFDLAVRLAHLQESEVSLPEGTLILLPSGLSTQAREALSYCAPPELQSVFLEEGTRVRAARLFVVDMPYYLPPMIPSWTTLDTARVHSTKSTFETIKKFLPLKASSGTGRRVFWSRSSSTMRDSPLLEGVLRSLAISYDFEEVDPAALSLLDQIRLMESVSASFGAYGSWLNLLALSAPKDSKHLVVCGDRPYEARHLFTTASELGLDICTAEADRIIKLPFYTATNYHYRLEPTPSLVSALSNWFETI